MEDARRDRGPETAPAGRAATAAGPAGPPTATTGAAPADDDDASPVPDRGPRRSWDRRRIGLVLGPFLMLVTLAVPAPEAFSDPAWRVAGLAAWMATWWITEAIPLGATGLLPLVMVPVLGAGSEVDAARPFASPVVFLFLGGFLLAAGVQKWRLHERIAYWTAGRVGMRPRRVVAGFMVATAVLSMWMSNTAAVILMLPMGACVIALLPHGAGESRSFGRMLMLGIAYAASIGGLATLIGTPPNAFLAAYSRENLAEPITFAPWLAWMLPFVVIALAASWFLLTFVLHRVRLDDIPGVEQLVRSRLDGLGAFRGPEVRVAAVFVAVAILWLTGPLWAERVPWPGDAGVAIAGAVLLFVLPSGRGRPLLVWKEAKQIPWGVLLLFGGGLSLAAAMDRTGLAVIAGDALAAWSGGSAFLIVVGGAALALVMTEFMSNTAAAAVLLPVLASVAAATGMDPLLVLVPATLMASCAFMMPAGTPPNALAISSGHVDVPTMAKAGVWMNLLFLVLVVGYVFLLDAVVW